MLVRSFVITELNSSKLTGGSNKMNVREENKVKRRSKNENESNNPLSYSSSDNINTTSNGLSLTYFGGL